MNNINSENLKEFLKLGDSTGRVINHVSHSGSGSVKITHHLEPNKVLNNDDDPSTTTTAEPAKKTTYVADPSQDYFTGWDDWECRDTEACKVLQEAPLKYTNLHHDKHNNDDDNSSEGTEGTEDTDGKPKANGTEVTTGNERTYYNGYKIPENLTKPFQPPFKARRKPSETSTGTDLAQTNPNASAPGQYTLATESTEHIQTVVQPASIVTPFKDNPTILATNVPKNPYAPSTSSLKPNNSEKDPATLRPSSPTQFTPPGLTLNLQESGGYEIRISPYLDKKFLPSSESLRLNKETEPLRALIMSQHRVFTQCILDLGRTNLNLSRFIVNKKTNLTYLNDSTKIPRSLRLNCGIVTSPALQNHPDFLQIQEDFQNDLTSFIKKGTAHMAKWQRIYIHILTIERCSTLLKKALPILEGLISFFTETLGTPIWPSIPENRLNLFLLKIYLITGCFKTNDLISHLEMPADQILLTAAKLIIKSSSDDEALAEINSISLLDLDLHDRSEHEFLSETLTAFAQVMDNTIVHLWQHEKESNKKTKAALNLQAKMESRETMDATAATALAIAKATKHLNDSKESELHNNLRITNLEKSLRRQEQRNNEVQNKFNKQLKSQKNFIGSHPKESMTSPAIKTPQNQTQKRKLETIDLSLEAEPEDHIEIPTNFKNRPPHQKRLPKRQQSIRHVQRAQPEVAGIESPPKESPPTSAIQWKTTSKMKSFNPSSPATKNPFTRKPTPAPIYFQPAPPPTLVNMHPTASYPQPHSTNTHYSSQPVFMHMTGQHTIPYTYYPHIPPPNPFNLFPPSHPNSKNADQYHPQAQGDHQG